MSVAVETGAPRRIAGVMARVSNSAPEKLGALWRRFNEEKIVEQLPGRVADDVYSVYFDYDSDEKGEFKALVGYAIDAAADVLAGLDEVTLEPGPYAVFDATGPQPETIRMAWSEIWRAPLRRIYRTDYDRYGADGSVTIHVGVL